MRHLLAVLTPCAVLSVAFATIASSAQSDGTFLSRYQARVNGTQAAQPHWVTPLVTVTPRLEQEFRTDFVRQINGRDYNTWNLGNGKGVEIIPARRIELLFNAPAFFSRSEPGEKDGFGDISFNSKFRIFSREEESGNSIITVFLAANVPTGKNGNGSCCAVVTPTLAMGKGYKLLALTTTLGGSLPVSNASKLGHTITWNNVAQYRLASAGAARFFWPELEFNSSFFSGGPNDGKIMTFATPGLIIGRIPLSHDESGRPGRLGLTFGAGEQIALTHFHTYNHGLIVSVRLPF
jgi:hypothetical protein